MKSHLAVAAALLASVMPPSAAHAASNQTQVFLVSSPVLEPITWAMLILGFGLVGHALRGKRRPNLVYI